MHWTTPARFQDFSKKIGRTYDGPNMEGQTQALVTTTILRPSKAYSDYDIATTNPRTRLGPFASLGSPRL